MPKAFTARATGLELADGSVVMALSDMGTVMLVPASEFTYGLPMMSFDSGCV
jgi:hypothetical protein